MALHDFRCPECGHVKTDVYVPISMRASAAVVLCDACAYDVVPASDEPASIAMEWIPQVGRMDCASGPSFKSFQMQQRQRDGSFKEITLNSLADLRRVERESEQAHRNGEGEAVRFRAWSNDRGNESNSFGEAPDAQVRRELAAAQAESRGRRRQRLDVIRGRRAEENARRLGPGVTEETASSLRPLDVLP